MPQTIVLNSQFAAYLRVLITPGVSFLLLVFSSATLSRDSFDPRMCLLAYLSLLIVILVSGGDACDHPCAKSYHDCGITQSCWEGCGSCVSSLCLPCLRNCSKPEAVACFTRSASLAFFLLHCSGGRLAISHLTPIFSSPKSFV